MATNAMRWFLGGLGLGAGVTYLFDPQQGRRRRAMLRDAVVHLANQQREVVEKGLLDLEQRIAGTVLELRTGLNDDEVDDPVLVARVRSTLGRCISHPGAIEVKASRGRVTLSGPIFSHEVAQALRKVRAVRGVTDVEDRLERHDDAGSVPALQGAGHVPRPLLEREVWPPSVRLLAMGAGLLLCAHGVRRGGLLGQTSAFAGGALALRGMTNLPARRMFGAGCERGAIPLTKSIFIDAPVEEVFDLWKHFEHFPRFMQHVKQVHVSPRAPTRSRWVVDGLWGAPVAFDAEITRCVEDEVIAWRSLPNPILAHEGVVHFQPEGSGTRVHLQMAYTPLAGALGHAVLRFFGSDPKTRLDDDLVRMKALLEQGFTRAHHERVELEALKNDAARALT